MKRITLRIPDELYEAAGTRARANRRSLNSEILAAMGPLLVAPHSPRSMALSPYVIVQPIAAELLASIGKQALLSIPVPPGLLIVGVLNPLDASVHPLCAAENEPWPAHLGAIIARSLTPGRADEFSDIVWRFIDPLIPA